MKFSFGEFKSNVQIIQKIPKIDKIKADLNCNLDGNIIIIADENTAAIADKICDGKDIPRCVLQSGEEHKSWESVQAILSAAVKASLGRDGIIIGVGGGVISDLAGFAASIYMRGCRLVLVSTTLLGMIDASVGGKTGIDFSGFKNLVGTFYPAQTIYMPVDTLKTLPHKEWKNGIAELIKYAVLSSDKSVDMLTELRGQLTVASNRLFVKQGTDNSINYDFVKLLEHNTLRICIENAVKIKGNIVTCDLRDTGKRMLLNLGHTFGHALESVAGLGKVSHGEAVAWGMARDCELGVALGITPKKRALKIIDLILSFGFELLNPHPVTNNKEALFNAMRYDKKNRQGKLTTVIPDKKGARVFSVKTKKEMKLLNKILNGEVTL